MRKCTRFVCSMLLCLSCVWNSASPLQSVTAQTQTTLQTTAQTAEFTVENPAFADIEKTVFSEMEVVKIQPKLSSTVVYLHHPDFDGMQNGERAHIDFQMFLSCDTDGYDALRLNTWGGLLVDYGFKRNAWNRVNFDGAVFTREGKSVVCLEFSNAIGKTLYVRDMKVNGDTFETEGIFGGVELYQYEPNSPHQTMMNGYLLVTPDDQLIVQDGGYIGDGEALLKLLNQYSYKVDAWFLSHYHVDHVTALTEILNEGDIVIENLYYNFSIDWPNLDGDKGCITALENAIEAHPEKVKNIITTKKGDTYSFGEYLTIKVLNDPDYVTQINSGNNTTVVYKAETPGEDILFLGDLGETGETYLQDPYFVREMRSCAVVQMAHHGQNGVSDRFYEVMDEIKVCLYPAPQWLYDVIEGAHNGIGVNELGSGPWNTLHTRHLMRTLGVRVSYPAFERVLLK